MRMYEVLRKGEAERMDVDSILGLEVKSTMGLMVSATLLGNDYLPERLEIGSVWLKWDGCTEVTLKSPHACGSKDFRLFLLALECCMGTLAKALLQANPDNALRSELELYIQHADGTGLVAREVNDEA